MPRAPLPGSLVWLRQRRWRVDRTRIDRRVVRIDVSHRSRQLTVLTPYDQPRVLAADARVVRVRRQHGLARLAHLLGAATSARLAHAAVVGRLDVWPHQLEPVLAVLDGQRRLLVADEVGLGKTIQAGLILAEVLRRLPLACALVITPASLRRQWTDELRDRFSIDARPAEETLDEHTTLGRLNRHRYRRPGVWLASIDYLKQPHVLDALSPDAWDVVVVDEAHLATGRSDRHELCDELGRRARHLVLLSATPHDGDTTRFHRLLRLGSLPYAADTLAIFRRTRTDIALPRRRVVRWSRTRLTPDLARLLDALQAFERAVLQAARPAARDAAVLLLSVFRKRALSTMAALDRSLVRRLEWLESASRLDRPDWQQGTLNFDSDDFDDDDRTRLSVDVGVPRAREGTWLRRLRTLVAAVSGCEPKLMRLRAYATRSAEPFVLFTEFRHSLEEAERQLGPVRSIAVIHGGQTDVVRERELSRFLSTEASVLIATDVGSQGLNLQRRARWVVNLELPWNPARLEQRIGRLDRIGQTRRVHATLLVSDHAAEHVLLAAIARRTLAARRELGPATLVDSAPPSHLAVASAVLTGTALPPSSPVDAGIRLSIAYRRRARAHAVVVTRRRRLVARWRGCAVSGRRPVLTRLTRAGLPPAVDTIVVMSAPMLDGAGDVIEQRLFAVTLPGPDLILRSPRALCARCQPLLATRVGPRLRRLRAWLAAVAHRRIAAERAIALHLHTRRHPGEAQLGLFSQHAATAFHDARQQAAWNETTTAQRLRAEEDRMRLLTGEGSVEWIGIRR